MKLNWNCRQSGAWLALALPLVLGSNLLIQPASAQYGVGQAVGGAVRAVNRAQRQNARKNRQYNQMKQQEKIMKEQAKLQEKQMKLQAKLQEKQMKLQAKLQEKQAKLQSKNGAAPNSAINTNQNYAPAGGYNGMPQGGNYQQGR